MDEKYARHGGDFILKFDDIVNELKSIYTQCGGEASAVANITTVGGMLNKVEEVAGSGGDISTTTMTVQNSTGSPVMLYGPFTSDMDMSGWPVGTYASYIHWVNGESDEVSVLITELGGIILVEDAGNYNISYSGDIIYGPGPGVYIVKGDCKLTIAEKV